MGPPSRAGEYSVQINGNRRIRAIRGQTHGWRSPVVGDRPSSAAMIGGGMADRSMASEVDTECSVPGCEKPVRARRLCSMHYTRWRTTGDVGEAASRKAGKYDAACCVEGCP